MLNKTFNFSCKVPAPGMAEMDIIPKTPARDKLTIVAEAAGMTPMKQTVNFKNLVLLAQGGDKTALTELCAAFEPLFRKEMRREMFYKGLGFEEGLSLARLKFIELVLTYNGADFEHFAGYVRCRIHFALYDALKKARLDENKTVPLTADGTENSVLCDDMIKRKELGLLLNTALAKLTSKQRTALKALYFDGLNNKETAGLLNCSPAMVTRHHQQALKKLKLLTA